MSLPPPLRIHRPLDARRRALLAWVLAAAAVAAPPGLAEDEEPTGPAPVLGLPRRAALEARWAELERMPGAPDAAALGRLLEESSRVGALVPEGPALHVSLWTRIRRTLAAREARSLDALRAAQEIEGRRLVDRLAPDATIEAVTALLRRAPWSSSVHDALLDAAEAELRAGRSGIARRLFADVARHAVDGRRDRARVGAWLCRIEGEAREADVSSLLEEIEPGRSYPWQGEEVSGARLRSILAARRSSAHPEATSRSTELPERAVRYAAPPVRAWPRSAYDRLPPGVPSRLPSPLGDLVAGEGHVLLAGPRVLAAYAADDPSPLWWRTPPSVTRGHGSGSPRRRDLVVVPGAFRPAIAGGRVYSRWGPGPACRWMRDVACFDLASGDCRWTTHDRPRWRRRIPVGDPVVVEGALLVLSTDPVDEGFSPLFLTCLDPDTGETRWDRHIASEEPGIERRSGPRFGARGIDPARMGSPVTVHAGAVYCSPHVGLVARCDARDGHLEWVRTYARGRVEEDVAEFASRQGCAPVVRGSLVVFAPRDRRGVFALHSGSGAEAWDRPDLPSRKVLALVGDTLLLGRGRTLHGVDVASGVTLWSRELPDEPVGRPLLWRGDLIARTRSSLVRIDAATGQPVATAEPPTGPAPEGVLLRGDTWLEIGRERVIDERESVETPTVPPLGLRLPLVRAGFLPRRDPRIVGRLPDPATSAVRLLVRSESLLEALDVSSSVRTIWRRITPADAVDVRISEDAVTIIRPGSAERLDPATGRLDRTREPPSPARTAARSSGRPAVRKIGGSILETTGTRATLRPLSGGPEVHLELPHHPVTGADDVDILDVRRVDDRRWVLSGRRARSDREDGLLRLDSFDAALGTHVATQAWPGIPREEIPRHPGSDEDDEDGPRASNQLVCAGPWALITTRRGIHLFATAPPEAPPAGSAVVGRLGTPVTIDGVLDDWPDSGGLELSSVGTDASQSRGSAGRLRLAHDGRRLLLAAVVPDESPTPAGGPVRGAGDWIECALESLSGLHRWGLSFDARGSVLVRGPERRRNREDEEDGPDVPAGLEGAVSHDLLRGRLVYELALPLDPLLHRWRPSWNRVRLAVNVWDDRPASGGARRGWSWGGELPAGKLMRGAGRGVWITDDVVDDVTEARELARATCELDTSLEWLVEDRVRRADGPASLRRHLEALIAEHPRAFTAERLVRLDRAARGDLRCDPSPWIAAAARASGVDSRECALFERLAAAFLVQRLRVPAGSQHPRSIEIELTTALSAGSRQHAGHFAKLHDEARPRPIRLLPLLPRDEWTSVRIPLLLLGLSDIPLHGIVLSQQGPPQVAWGETRLERDGKSKVWIGRPPPVGRGLGAWEWIEAAGEIGHRGPPVVERYQVARHGLVDMRRPATHHVVPRPGGPTLTQEVRVDPESPPERITLSLHDGDAWQSRSIWGRPGVGGRWMGPLPPAGSWRVLRVPLGTTPLASRPIWGLAWGASGGRAIWGRTVVEGPDDKASTVVDGAFAATAPPPLLPDPGAGRLGGCFVGDGRARYVGFEHSDSLEPARVTVEAWFRLDRLVTEGETRRWVVGKTRHECTRGHWGLVVRADRVGAYVNVGEGEEGRRDAWSEEGAVHARRWHHLAMTSDGAALAVWLDGERVARSVLDAPLVPGGGRLTIGRRPDGYVYFPGRIDEVRIWRRALVGEELRRHVQAPHAVPSTPGTEGLVAWLPLEDRSLAGEPCLATRWVDAPGRPGELGHTHDTTDSLSSHAVFPLRAPVVGHLRYDPRLAARTLDRGLSRLGGSEAAWSFLHERLRLDAHALERRAGVLRRFLAALPDHPRAEEARADLERVQERLVRSRRERFDDAGRRSARPGIESAGAGPGL